MTTDTPATGPADMSDQQITIADVAVRAGVSKSTVSRVLNGRGGLARDTVDRVRRVIAEFGYVPSARAVSLARGRTQTVGLLLPSLTWPWIGDVLQGVADVLENTSHGMLLFTANRGEDSIRQFTTQVSARSIDGLIVILPEGSLDRITELQDRGLPVILIDDRESRPRFTSVRATNYDGGSAAAHHLLELGRQRPLVIAGDRRFECTRERLAGFLDGYNRAGLPVAPDLVLQGDFTFESGRDGLRHALRCGLPFDAVFALNDLSAMGALQALRREGIHVPNDVAVIGFDDIPAAMHTEPPLTSVRQPRYEMGATAVRLLLDKLAGRQASGQTVAMSTELIPRGTTCLTIA